MGERRRSQHWQETGAIAFSKTTRIARPWWHSPFPSYVGLFLCDAYPVPLIKDFG